MDSGYSRIERAIRYLEDHAGDQPGLDEVAEQVDLSPYHFQRVFKKWAGISPKRYLQFLTVEKAKKLLDRSASVLETAYDVGLSGAGRLHDLFLSVESVTPGQYKTGGAGIHIKYGFHQTPFGRAMLAITGNGVTDLMFAEDDGEGDILMELERKWPAAFIEEDNYATGKIAERVFGSNFQQDKGDGINLVLCGTNFQIKVWLALLCIPKGAIVSYSDVAGSIGRPDAVRAVARAVGSNPIAWLIPCHRVLRRSGEIGGYRWGVTRKKIMLAQELAGE